MSVWRSVTLTWRQHSSGANIMKRLAVPLRAAVVPPAHSEEFAHVRQKYDQGCYGGCNTTLDARRPRARKRWHRKYVHRHRGANGACRTRNKTERLDSAARRSNESAD